MKKLVLFLLLTLSSTTLFSQEQTLFIDKKYDDALAQSKTEKKPLVILFYAKWCPHCNTMKKEVFTDSTVTTFYRKNYVLMSVDAESSYGTEIRTKFQSKFRVTNFPTFVFLSNDENLLYCTSGELKKERFLSEGANVLLPENQLGNIKIAFSADPSNAEKCLKFITNLKKAGFDATSVAEKYLATVKPEEKFTEMNWRVFANGISGFESEEFKFVMQNREAFSKVITPSRIDKKIIYNVSEGLKASVDRADTISYNKKRSIVVAFKMQKIDSIVYRTDLQIYPQVNDWKNYRKAVSGNIEKFSWKDTVVLYDICNTYFQAINDKKSLQQAVEWSKHLLTLGESLDRYVLTSKLLMKLKEYKQALDFARKGKALAESLGLKGDEINTLLEQIKKNS